MANAANSPFVKHPALLALFAPRPPPPFKAPMPTKPMGKLTGIAQFTAEFGNMSNIPPPKKFETPTERKLRLKEEKEAQHKLTLAEREKQWDPHNNPKATKDPYKTLFVARLSYDLTKDDLRREFERYGRIREVTLIKDKNTNKSRGYAFIEFERSNDLKEAFQHADGHKLKGRRILVDVERGRTVKGWKPRKLGGGLGKTRANPNKDSRNGESDMRRHGSNRMGHSPRDRGRHNNRSSKKDGKYSNRRDKYRDRDYRDRDRKGNRDRGKDNRDRKRSRDRKERSDRDRSRTKKEDRGSDKIKKERERDRGMNNRRERSKTDRDRSRRGGQDRDKNRSRRG